MIAARVAEVVTGKDYETLMSEVLFESIGAEDATFSPSEDQKRRIPTAYERDEGRFRIRQRAPLGNTINPGGQLCSTLDDVARMMMLHRNKGLAQGRQVVSGETLAAMYVPPPATPAAGYGLGFNVLRKATAQRGPRVRHTGASGTLAWIDFDLDLIVIVLTQVPQVQTTRWRQQVVKKVNEIFAP
jgi:CubicO group peptidase (beta-lactamase class C family)